MTRERRMISGRVPTTVITLSLATEHLVEIGIGTRRIERLARPEQHDHLRRSHVLDAVRHAGRNVDDLEFGACNAMLRHFGAEDGPEANDGLAIDHTELLDLEVVDVIAAR